jgi:hypothetical protein
MTVAVAVPDRSLAQRLEALKRGNAIRLHRAATKRRWKTEPRTLVACEIAGILADVPPEWASMKVYDLLRAVPTLGHTRCSAILVRHGVTMGKSVGGLSERQRDLLERAMLTLTPTPTNRQ